MVTIVPMDQPVPSGALLSLASLAMVLFHGLSIRAATSRGEAGICGSASTIIGLATRWRAVPAA